MRTSESRATRVRWWIALLALIGLALAHNHAVGYLLTLWNCGNLGLGFACFMWMLFHPRTLGRSSNTAIGWSRWLTLVSALALYGLGAGQAHAVAPSVLLLLVAASAPILFVVFLMFSLFGASIGAFVGRRRADVEHSAVAAVVGWWVSVILVIIVILFADMLHMSDAPVTAIILGVPIYTIFIGSLVGRVIGGEARAPLHLVDMALRRLVFTVGPIQKRRTFDLRGVAIGLLTAVLTLSLARELIAPAQQSILASMFRLRKQLIGAISIDAPTASNVVLIKLDATASASAVTTSSEAAVQARMIRRLKAANVATIVLTAPVIDVSMAGAGETSEAAVAQTRRDLPDLANAVRESGKVLLIVSPAQHASPVLKPLLAAAAEVGQFGEEAYGPAQLPTVPLKWTGDPPASLLALAMRQGARLMHHAVAGVPESEMQEVNGYKIATVIPFHAVVDLRTGGTSGWSNEDVPNFPYGDILNGKTSNPNALNSPAIHDFNTYLARKVVLLEPLIHPDVETPVGPMPKYDVLARTTGSLIQGTVVAPGSRTAGVFWTLILGILIGTLCVGRDPLQASWRVALLMLLNFGYSVVAYLIMDTWADPVLPLVTATIAFLLVTQFTFALERDERDRNRALFSRFIAKEFVDELLQSPTSKLALGGEKRTVCVLFADVRNFTGFAESHRPEEVIEIMNIYLTALTDALDLYGGLLDKYTGDGLMAFFEIKGDVRTELVRSVNASLAMRDAAVDVSKRLQAAGKKSLQIGIGMHYGEAIVGLVGNEQRQINYTALGHTVVVSARLQTLAEGGEVVVSEPIFAEVKEHFLFSSMPAVFVKGISAEQRPYQVTRFESAEGVSAAALL